jgi:hypothetical protein
LGELWITKKIVATANTEKLVRPTIVMPFGIEPTILGMAKIVGLL